MATDPTLVPPQAGSVHDERTEQLRQQILDLLRHEARLNLGRDAEMHSPDEEGEEGFHTRRWYGFELSARDELHQLQAKHIAHEFQLRQLADEQAVAAIREEVGRVRALGEAVKACDAQLAAIDDRVAAIAQELEAATETRRTQLVEDETRKLYDKYLYLSQHMPFSAHHPNVPEPLRRWATKWLAKTQNPVSRLYIYLALRESIFHGATIGAPVVSVLHRDGDGPSLSALALAGEPRTKKEARDQDILARQFLHPNGDARTHRYSPLSQLHEQRIAAKRSGKEFLDRLDYNETEYDGTPELKALGATELARCAECGGVVKDMLAEQVPTEAEPDLAQGWVLVVVCDCSRTVRTPVPFATRDLLVAQLQQQQLLERQRHETRVAEQLKPRRRAKAAVA